MRASPAPAGDARPAPRRETRLRLEGQLRSPVAPQVAAAPADDWVQTQASLRGATPAMTEATLKSFVGAHPGPVAARQALVTALLQGNRVAEAVPVLRDGLAAAPEQVGWAMTLARIQAGSNDYSAAYETLTKSAAHAQALPDYQAFVGTVLQRLDRAAEALTHYEAALRARPQEARWWVGYGIALEAAGRMADAREAYARARGIGGLTTEVRQFVDERLR